jgi:uncharacterized protein (TIGR02996 family)
MTQAAPGTLLEAALAMWRRSGAPEDAAALDARTRAALTEWSPPPASSARTFHRAWLRAVDDPVGRGWGLATLLEYLPGDDRVQRACALAKRIEALTRHGPDPRFGAAAARVRSSDAATSVARLWSALVRLEAAAAPDPAPPAQVKAFPPATPEIAALWQAVHARPDDDGALAVLADALQGIGDPRGELLALQLAAGDGGDDAARVERRRVLLASCGAAWLGGLAPITGSASFERGVLRRWQLDHEILASDRRWHGLVEDPGLATVTDLVGTAYNRDGYSEMYARFVASPAMCSLARIDVHDRRSIDALGHAAPSLRHVAVAASSSYPPDPGSSLRLGELIDALGARPGVTSIAITESMFDRFAAAPWFPRLSALTLGVGSQMRRGLTRWGALPPGMQLTLVPDARVPPCAWSFPWDFGVTLRREDRGAVARISGEWLLLPLDVLTALPDDVVRVEVDHGDAGMAERIREALARPAVEIVHRPEPRRAVVFVPAERDVRRAR